MKTLVDFKFAIDKGLITHEELLRWGILPLYVDNPLFDGRSSCWAVPPAPFVPNNGVNYSAYGRY